MCEKRKNGAECIGGIKIQTLTKYKDLMIEWHRTKSLSKDKIIHNGGL